MQFQRRHRDRRRVLKGGTIEFGATALSTVPCVLKDIGDGGARLQIDHPMWFPDSFQLSFDSERERRSCRVVWRDGRKVGVVFTDIPSAGS